MNLTLQINPKYDRIKIEMPYIMTRSVLLSLELDPALRFRQLSEVRPTHNEFFHIQKTQFIARNRYICPVNKLQAKTW